MTIGSIAMAIKNTVIPSVAKELGTKKIYSNNLIDCFGSSLRNDDKLNFEIISLNNKNKNLKLNNYYGFLFNKKFHCQKEE